MLYDYMYLIPKEEYRSLQTTSSDHAKLVDSIAGDVNGGQVNHIEIGEGGRVTIKPTDIAASGVSKKKSTKVITTVAEKDKEFEEIPYTRDESTQSSHPDFVSKYSQTKGHTPETISSSSQTTQTLTPPSLNSTSSQTPMSQPMRDGVAQTFHPTKRSIDVQVVPPAISTQTVGVPEDENDPEPEEDQDKISVHDDASDTASILDPNEDTDKEEEGEIKEETKQEYGEGDKFQSKIRGKKGRLRNTVYARHARKTDSQANRDAVALKDLMQIRLNGINGTDDIPVIRDLSTGKPKKKKPKVRAKFLPKSKTLVYRGKKPNSIVRLLTPQLKKSKKPSVIAKPTKKILPKTLSDSEETEMLQNIIKDRVDTLSGTRKSARTTASQKKKEVPKKTKRKKRPNKLFTPVTIGVKRKRTPPQSDDEDGKDFVPTKTRMVVYS